jgi:hypothetical protein
MPSPKVARSVMEKAPEPALKQAWPGRQGDL